MSLRANSANQFSRFCEDYRKALRRSRVTHRRIKKKMSCCEIHSSVLPTSVFFRARVHRSPSFESIVGSMVVLAGRGDLWKKPNG